MEPTGKSAEQIALGRSSKLVIITLIIVLVVGVFLRIYPMSSHTPSSKVDRYHPGTSQIGFDEDCYRRYLMMLDANGLTGYPAVARGYLTLQPKLSFAILPPMRVTFLVLAYLFQLSTKASPLASLHCVSCLFTVLALAISAIFAWRLGGPTSALGVAALMSFAPLQIQLAQRAYIDGIFAFWTLLVLWMLWENLRAPRHYRLLVAYAVGLAFLVMTKENAAFVFAGVLGLIVFNRWLRFGEVTVQLLVATLVGPLLGVFGLILAAGGFHTLVDIYRLNVSQSQVLPYAIKTGDGPWFRYALDLVLVSPVLTLIAVAGMLNMRRGDRVTAYLALFVGITYLVMANVKYGMNVRYASIWDMPLRWIAVGQLSAVSAIMPRRIGTYFPAIAVGLLCLLDLHQYFLFFVKHGLYDPIPESMLRILNILK